MEVNKKKMGVTTLRDKFESEKRRISYEAFHYETVKNRLNLAASPSTRNTQKSKPSLPSYLEIGKATPDRALSFGVMDYGRLEKWQYQHLKHGPIKSSKCSSSSSVSSTDVSSSHSSRGRSCSPAHRVTLQSHFNKTHEPSMDTGNCQTKLLSLKGKMKIQDPSYETHDHDHLKTPTHCSKDSNSENIRSYLKNNPPRSFPVEKRSSFSSKIPNLDTGIEKRSSFSSKIPNLDTGIEKRSSFSSKIPNLDTGIEKRSSFSSKISNLDTGIEKRSSFSSKIPNLDTVIEKRSSFSSKISNLDTGNATSKPRSMSPIRRFSFSMSSKSPISQKSTTGNNTYVSNRSSSPLRRLLEPLFPIRATNSRQENAGKQVVTESKQALFQTAIKNGRPMFTFAVEKSNVLAATVNDLSSSGKNNSWIYTFFTIDEVKKKNGTWLSHNKKEKSPDYVPNLTAQMKVSNRADSNSNTREFVLFHVDESQLKSQTSIVDPHDELAAIVVKFSGNVGDKEENPERFSTTVVLPGGNHGGSSGGKPSPLIKRWLSGGGCDCGGWDLGCRLRTLTNQVQSNRKSNLTASQFQLFFQGDVINEKCFFSLSPLKEGMFSVEYNSSLSILQAFSICISVVECRKSCEDMESRTYIAKEVEDDPNLVTFASFPPLSPVGRV